MSTSVPFEQKAFFKSCRQLVKQKKNIDALTELKQAIHQNLLDAGGLSQAGRLLEKLNLSSNLNIALLGQFTTSYLSPVLKAMALPQGHVLSIVEESYDNVMQSLLTLEQTIDVVILLPWHQRLMMQSSRSPQQRLEEELSFWQQAWQLISKNSNTRIIQVGYDWIDAGAAGQFLAGQGDGDISLIRQLNQKIRSKLPESAYFIDLEQVSGHLGRQQFYDARSYHWTKQPLSEQGVIHLSKVILAGIRTSIIGPKKVLVLDLDNTLWGGVVGEKGAHGIELGDNPTGEAFKNFQLLAKQLRDNGCVLAICSKNNDADAREPFETNPDMILKLDDFAAFKAGWGPKSEAIKQIALELKLGLDSFVFFDDSKAEQEEVRMALPEVSVIDTPEDPSDFRQALLDGLWFESIQRTLEDSQRAQHYQHERQRVESQSTFNSIEDYLVSLTMTADIRELNNDDIDRVVQLLGKTNQFNLTTRRHSREDVMSLISQPESIGLTARLTDKFGDYGLVSVILATKDTSREDATLIIDSWLMSCRTISRTLEHHLFNQLLSVAKANNFKRIVGEYIPTQKNVLAKNLFSELGCTPIDKNTQRDSQWFELDLDSATNVTTFVNSTDNDD